MRRSRHDLHFYVLFYNIQFKNPVQQKKFRSHMAAEPNLSAHIFKLIEVSRLDAFYALQYFARRKIPPSQYKKRGDIFVRKPFADWLCRHATHNRVWRNILRHDRTRAYNGAVAYCNASKNDRFKAYPHIVADYDISLALSAQIPCSHSS